MPLDPQNRVHTGISLTDYQLAKGVNIGLDSRMTRLVYVDVGGFMSLTPALEVDLDEATDAELVELRHGLTVAPGVRIPHRYTDGINWDLTIRAGFGAVWAADASSDQPTRVDPALLSGMDLLIRKNNIGLRTTGRVFGFNPYTKRSGEVPMVRPQYAVELVYQW